MPDAQKERLHRKFVIWCVANGRPWKAVTTSTPNTYHRRVGSCIRRCHSASRHPEKDPRQLVPRGQGGGDVHLQDSARGKQGARVRWTFVQPADRPDYGGESWIRHGLPHKVRAHFWLSFIRRCLSFFTTVLVRFTQQPVVQTSGVYPMYDVIWHVRVGCVCAFLHITFLLFYQYAWCTCCFCFSPIEIQHTKCPCDSSHDINLLRINWDKICVVTNYYGTEIYFANIAVISKYTAIIILI